MKSFPGDFRVDEILGFKPLGEGEHLWLYVEKMNRNTMDIVRMLARRYGLRERDIGYSGLKDKRAVTRQWLSLPATVKALPEDSDEAGFRVLRQVRHQKKLKRGTHKRNGFTLRIRELDWDEEELGTTLASLRQQGFPNYFGEQRFGIERGNLIRGDAWLRGTVKPRNAHQKGLLLSAMRSWLFNLVVSQRLRQGSWQRPMAGDIAMLAGSNSVFGLNAGDDDSDPEILRRIAEGDISLTGPLFGHRRDGYPNRLQQRERAIVEDYRCWLEGLENKGLKMERRSMRAFAHSLCGRMVDRGTAVIEFELERGQYATSLLFAAGLTPSA